MPACNICGNIYDKESGLKRHITARHKGVEPAPPSPVDDFDIDLSVTDDPPLADDFFTAPPKPPAKPKRQKAVKTQPDSSQIADMMLFMLDGIIAMSMGEWAKIDPIEHEYIDPALRRLIDRYLPATLSDSAASYADVIFLGFGVSMWAIRVYRTQQAIRTLQPPPVPDRFDQQGTLTYEGPPEGAYSGPLNNTTEASVLRTVQRPPNGVAGEPPIGVTPPIWDDSVGMQDL